MLRWSLMLAGYDYTMGIAKGKNNKNSDSLSSLLLRETVSEVSSPSEVIVVSKTDD